MTKDNNWGNSFNDYGFNHGFQSRGIAPSFLGSDSLPQGIGDLHWALHGIQNNVDELDSKINTFNDNIADIAKGMKNNIIEYLGDKLAGSKTPLTTSTGYLSKIMTTRTRIFSDRFSAESSMNPVDRIRGLTKNYDWVQYTQANPTCEGEYDKIIDFNFISDFQENDAVDSLYVSKGRIILEKCGLIKRIHVTQKGSNIVVWYLVTQSVPSSTGVAYTGAIRRVEYDKNSNKISERWQQVNHTPLVFLGAFNIDANNDGEYIQYISTDYKVYQNINGIDTEMGHLPNEIILMIDPLNDIVSDSKQAYIMKYSDEGMLHFPLEGFTLIDTMDTGEIVEKFKKITFNPNSKIFNSISSISPRSSSMLTRTEEPNKVISSEGGYYVEIIDKNSVYPEVSHSHILLLSSSEEIYDVDRNTKTIFNYHSDYPSEFALKRERDYLEFDSITFGSKISRMFPEVAKDFGINDETRFTVQFDASRQKCRLTVWLDEPFVIERVIADSDVNNRLGYTVINNSDNVRDIADTDVLSVYKNLDFTTRSPYRNYLTSLPRFDSSYQLPSNLRYHVIKPTDTERKEGILEITYFDEYSKIIATINTSTKQIVGNLNFSENYTSVFNRRSNKISPSVNSNMLSELIHSELIHLEGKSDHIDKPYGSKQYTLANITTGSRITQVLRTSLNTTLDTNLTSTVDNTGRSVQLKNYTGVPNEEVTFTRSIINGKVGEWSGNGYISEIKYLNIPGMYNIGSNEAGSYFRSNKTNHEVFKNITGRLILVDGFLNNMNHVTYRITNDIGLSMEYHNIVIREDRSDTVGYTSKPYRLMYEKWIPGEYVGNDDYPQGPDIDAFSKELLKQISILRSRSLSVTDTTSIDFTVTGNWNTDKRSSWNANTNSWTTDPNDVNISAVVKLSRETEAHQSSNNQQVQLPNAIKIKNDGVYSPDYGLLVSNLVNKINELSTKVEQLSNNTTSTGNAVKTIVNSLIASGAWDPNKTNVNPGNAPITGGIKDGVNIAYGNINLFGGTPDGNSYIRTNKGQTENDLAGGI